MSSGESVKRRSGIAQFLDGVSKKRELGMVGGRLRAASGGEQTELHSAIHVGEKTAPILEVEQADQ